MARPLMFKRVLEWFRGSAVAPGVVEGGTVEGGAEIAEAGAGLAGAIPAGAVKLREAFGITADIDGDDANWRRLSGDTDRDLTPMDRARMREQANYLWQTNLLANRMIELPIAYLLAEGVSLVAKDQKAQQLLDAFWHDPINRMDLKLIKKMREMALHGEQCWPVFVNDQNGRVRLGNLDPSLIATVVVDPDNPEQPIGVVTVKDRKGRARRYRVIVMGPEEDCFTQRTREIRAGFADGDCFYYAINEITSVVRGHSALLGQMDWLDAYEQFLFGEVDRAQIMRTFLWDVELTGATPEEVKARAKDIPTPKQNSMRVHNDSEKWTSQAPELGSYESSNAARMFRNHMLSGSTLPEHWFGGGGDVNRATASEMGDPTYKMLAMMQRIWRLILQDIGRFVISRGRDPSGAEWIGGDDDDLTPQAIFPELLTKDISSYAAALVQVVQGCASAIDRELMTDLTALRIINAVAGRLGVEIDAESELAAAKQEAATRKEADSFSELPEDEDPADLEGAASGDRAGKS